MPASCTILAVVGSSLKAVGQMLLLLSVGGIAASRQLISNQVHKALATLVTTFFMPSLLFANLSASASVEVLQEAVLLPVVAVVYCTVGVLLGWVATRTVLRGAWRHADHRLMFLASCTVGNSQGIPLVLTSVVVTNENDWRRCVQYISIYIFGIHLVTWLGVYNVLKGHVKASGGGDAGDGEGVELPESPMGEAHVPLNEEGEGDGESEPGFVVRCCAFFSSLANPPLVAVALGLLVGLVPFLREVLVDEGGVLQWMHTGAAKIGGSAIPLIMCVIGASMYDSLKGGRDANFAPSVRVVLVAIRFLALPLLGLAAAHIVRSLRPSTDPLLLLVVLLESCLPTANNMAAICARLGMNPSPIAGALLLQYATAIPVYALYITVALSVTSTCSSSPSLPTHGLGTITVSLP
eukprot:Sspe_Gene.21244::Locus_7934_Transcript_1_1_Confidence_1.000_Length_2542::g.21244::m.21244